jgi:hypothetical protein
MKKILLFLYTFVAVISSCSLVNGQDSCGSMQKPGGDWELGLQGGTALLIESPHSNQANKYAFTEGVFVKKDWNDQLSMNIELNYATIKNTGTSKNIFTAKGTGKMYNISIPVTVEYNIRLSKKLKTFVGTGVVFNTSQDSYTLFNFKEGYVNSVKTIKTNTSTGSLIFTQGITYDISPRISIKESVHFIPKGPCNCKQYGIAFGIGLKL